MVTIARFPDEAQARLAAAKLEAEGIQPIVEDRIPARALGRRAALLSVLPADAARATAILEDSPARSFLVAE
jgi:hypothetical protein